MNASAPRFERLQAELPAIQSALRDQGLDGWLLYDLHARNTAAVGLLGLGDLSRRYFVLIPAQGEPVALTHGIEQGPWRAWPWTRHTYVGWRPLEEALQRLLADGRSYAMEWSARDAVPACDLVPAGVVELVRAAGADVKSSGELITRFHSRWSPDQLAAHRRAAEIIATVARESLEWLAEEVGRRAIDEGALREHVVAELVARGYGEGADCIAATGLNAANPHYEPVDGGATFERGNVVLLDLWCKETALAAYADQTWMACLADRVPPRAADLFATVCRARDAAVRFVEEAWAAGREVRGYEVDDVARNTIVRAGCGDHFIHRTGHSIDTATHGMGPNIDNLETHETRQLVPGIGFSIEPGIYIDGEIGVRTEINVYMGDNGPEVTPSRIQSAMMTFGGS